MFYLGQTLVRRISFFDSLGFNIFGPLNCINLNEETIYSIFEWACTCACKNNGIEADALNKDRKKRWWI